MCHHLGEDHVRGEHHELAIGGLELRRPLPRAASLDLGIVLLGLGRPRLILEEAEVLVAEEATCQNTRTTLA